MKKAILAILTACALMTSVHAQTVVVHRSPGVLTDLVGVAGALLTLPIAVAEGVALGVAETADAILTGSTTVYTTPAPVYVAPAPAPVVVAPAPVYVAPAPAPVVVAPAPVQTTTTVTRTVTTTRTTTVTRPSYEVVVPRQRVIRYRHW